MSNIQDIADTLSDFQSCKESSASSSSDESEASDRSEKSVLQSVNDKKRLKKAKRKLALTPGKEQFLKKPKSQGSPK